MNLKKTTYVFILMFTTVFLPGKIQKYKLQNNINYSPNVVLQNIDGVIAQKLELSILESKDIFGEKKGIKINSNFQPILFSIKNDSNQAVTMYRDDIDLNLLDSSDVVKKIKKNFLLKSFLYTSLYFGYLAMALPLGIAFAMPLGAPDLPFWAPAPLAVLVALVYGLPILMISDVYNNKLYNDSLNESFIENTVSDNSITTILPDEEIFKLIFVDQDDYDGILKFELTAKDNKKIKFEL